ncbi:DEAD/DEAH box helicase [Nocardiopsis sp. RSe5-2]|uniref:DEAD/DEAH box helicase n=1 Tax=Nocardiopsis endophytica TaxID=3018445 RepID=A0ABT4TYJ9_9ACTN|nr:DEAD/DEAH box helicase [Nocardiopsis endophytica]MDA2809778.1 DEAD/DEAH box helicase [Nocardiopsis endophytica]
MASAASAIADHGTTTENDPEPVLEAPEALPEEGAEAPEGADAPAAQEEAPEGFAALPLGPRVQASVAQAGFTDPTPIQREAIPPLVAGRDLLGQAATGTGKTAAFALPILQMLADRPERTSGAPAALILVPTRELAVQVCEAVETLGAAARARVLPVYGGTPIGRQLRALERGVDAVVATPGRALDLMGRGGLVLDRLSMAVLDEADEMLDMGFAEDIEQILEQTPADCQRVLFSATMPSRIEALAQSHLSDPVRVRIAPEKQAQGEAPRVRQCAYLVPRGYKEAALARLLEAEDPGAAIVFCATREEVERVTEAMNARGRRAEALHGGMGQEHRDRVMGRLRSGAADLLVATDVAARGIDVDHLTHVVNFGLPAAPESYVHRTGRVGRAGREGVALTVIEPRDQRRLKAVRRATASPIEVEQVPTVEQMRRRRLERTRQALHRALSQDGGARGDATAAPSELEEVLGSLREEFGAEQVALEALRMAHGALAPAAEGEQEIPQVPVRPEADRRGRRGERPERDRGSQGPGRRPGRGPSGDRVRLFVGAGRSARVRPQDLVGAIAGEAGLSGRDIGAIEIAERFSLVEVPASDADRVIDALQGAMIKGRKAVVRRDAREGGGPRQAPKRRPAGRGPRD